MVDIVERLRDAEITTTMEVAADEIERLREALRLMPKTITEAADEIERMRTALWDIIVFSDDYDGAVPIARKALGEKE